MAELSQKTSLMWSQSDSHKGMDWVKALQWVQEKNKENYLGHSDWRLPDVHGAGAQRTDKKVVDAKQSMGGSAPQGDALRVTNYLRIVRSLNNG